MKNILDIAWLAGLLEGEGSFVFKGSRATPCISLQTTDRDVLLRAAGIMEVKEQNFWRPGGKASYKPVYTCRAHGTRAISWMMTIYSLMGERRQEKIREIIVQWTAQPRMPRASRGQRLMATCHPDRPRCADLLCRQCWSRTYMMKYRAAKKAALATLFTLV
jgi:hypothetical protein